MTELADEDDFTHYFNACGRLTKENGELRAEIERLRRELSYHVHTDEDIKVQNAEIDRLQAALQAISDRIPGLGHEGVGEIARRALEPKP